MKSVESSTRSKFFTNPSKVPTKANIHAKKILKGNDSKRQKEIDNITQQDADVKISDAIKDFSRIKKMVDQSPKVDNSERIAQLKKQIQEGTYTVNYEAIADKIINSEF